MSNEINDWKKCVFCQKRQKGSNKDKPGSMPEGLVGESKLISEFIERNINTEFINRVLKELQQENHQSISDLFAAKKVCYHHRCILDQRHKLKIAAHQSPQDSGSSQRKGGNLLGKLNCLLCIKINTQESLIEAGIKYSTKKKVNVSHANETTAKWRDMASALGKTEIESKL